jgi:rhodanese-related sulfurtransferase
MTTKTISVKKLETLLRLGEERVLVVDVRQDDFIIGKILGSVHMPFDRFPEPAISSLRALVEQMKPKYIITHCHFCQTRGPKTARMLQYSGVFDACEVLYLEGGWEAWSRAYGGNADLVEKL